MSFEGLIKQVESVGHNSVAIDIVNAGQEEVIGIHEVIRNGGEVGLDTDKEAPAEIEHVTGSTRRFPKKRRGTYERT